MPSNIAEWAQLYECSNNEWQEDCQYAMKPRLVQARGHVDRKEAMAIFFVCWRTPNFKTLKFCYIVLT